METKALELRDEGTFIPILCVNMQPFNPLQRYLLRRCGYACDGVPNIIMTRLDGNGRATNDPYSWGDGSHTFPVAHNWIIANWATLKDGDVVDVEFILGKRDAPKVTERLTSVWNDE